MHIYGMQRDVRVYSGKEKDYSWDSFIEAFSLKYPTRNWRNVELKTLLKSKLASKAKAQCEALSREIRHGPFKCLVTALAEANKVEAQTGRVIALGQLGRLKKAEGQSVAEYCVQLEKLSAMAYLSWMRAC